MVSMGWKRLKEKKKLNCFWLQILIMARLKRVLEIAV